MRVVGVIVGLVGYVGLVVVVVYFGCGCYKGGRGDYSYSRVIWLIG